MRLYDTKSSKLSWEQELYNGMKFESPRPFLVTFEGDKEMVCLNFADKNEMSSFYQFVCKKTGKRKSSIILLFLNMAQFTFF
jgi:WH1 domain